MELIHLGMIFDDLCQHGLEIFFPGLLFIEDLEFAGQFSHVIVLIFHGDELM